MTRVRCPAVVILDRDGVINENRADHVKSWEEFRFISGAREAIARLAQAGVRVFVVSNQAAVNRGLLSASNADAINLAMAREIERCGGNIEAVVYCPHRPDEGCGCRKPRPGLLQALAQYYRFDLSQSVLIGDALTDVQAGQAAGCANVMVLTGRGRDQLLQVRAANVDDLPIADDLQAAVDMLLKAESAEAPAAHEVAGTAPRSYFSTRV
jgi:D-glycero-D-manno-heptose 1,7-bisphosphate phosphatase